MQGETHSRRSRGRGLGSWEEPGGGGCSHQPGPWMRGVCREWGQPGWPNGEDSASTAGSMGVIPGQGIKSFQQQQKQKKNSGCGGIPARAEVEGQDLRRERWGGQKGVKQQGGRW